MSAAVPLPLRTISTGPALAYEPNLAGHLPALDGLRGIAILLVMLFHNVPVRQIDATSSWGETVIHLIRIGWVGVDLFFVLSGFLITGILFDAKQRPHYFRNFYARRALRIFPLYYGVLLALFVLLPIFKPLRGHAMNDLYHHQAWLWLYGTNLLIARESHFINAGWMHVDHFWSLAVEEHFYLVWPAVILLLSRKGAQRFCVACIAVALACRIGLFLHGPDKIHYALAASALTPCRMDGLAIGALIALAIRGPRGIRPLRPWAISCALLGGFYLGYCILRNLHPTEFFMGTFGYTLIALCFGGILFLAVAAAPATLAGRFFSLGPLRILGKYSYGLYVFHLTAWPLIHPLFPLYKIQRWAHSENLGVAVYTLAYSTAIFLMAYLSWHLYEKQFLKLKRFFPQGSRPLPR